MKNLTYERTMANWEILNKEFNEAIEKYKKMKEPIQYTFLPTGEVWTRMENFENYQNNSHAIPSYIVENGVDWKKVEVEKIIIKSVGVSNNETSYSFTFNKSVSINLNDFEVYLNKGVEGEVYTREDMIDFATFYIQYPGQEDTYEAFDIWKSKPGRGE